MSSGKRWLMVMLGMTAWLTMGAVRAADLLADAPPPSHGEADRVYGLLARASAVVEGHAGKRVYVFFDPNCPYCHYLYQVTKPFVARGQVEVHWIPVGFLVPSSAGKAAAILGARNPRLAFEENENHYRRPGGGGIAPIVPDARVKAKLDHNLALFDATQAGGVPLILWRDIHGQLDMQDGAVDRKGFAYILSQTAPTGGRHPAQPAPVPQAPVGRAS